MVYIVWYNIVTYYECEFSGDSECGIIIIIFIETRLQDTIGKVIKYRWLGR